MALLFSPPSVNDGAAYRADADIVTRKLWGHMARHQTGVTVLKTNGVYVEQQYVYHDDMVAADIVYQGGHIYPVDWDEALDLLAAGYELTGFGKWATALRDADTSPALWLAIGDSISEGWSASSPALRWLQLSQDDLRAAYPVANNEAIGYLPAWRNATTTSLPGAYQPTAAGNVTGKINAGPGFRSAAIGQTVGELSWFAMTASGGTWTITYGGNTTPALAWDISADGLKAAMNALPSIGGAIEAVGFTSGIFDPLFPEPSRHWYPQWSIASGNITPGTVDSTNLTGGTVTWGTWSQGGVAGTVTYPNLDADMIDIWVRRSAYTNGVTCAVDGTDRLTIATASGGGDHDSNHHYVYMGAGTHTIEFRENDTGGFPTQLDGLFAYKGDGPTGGHVELHGNDWLYTADSAATSVAGDLEVRIRFRAEDVAAEQTLISKWGSFGVNERSWRFGITAAGELTLSTSANGTASVTHTSTGAAIHAGIDYWARFRLDVDNGAAGHTVTFDVSVDDTYDDTAVVWAQVGSPVVTAGTTSLFDSPQPLTIGRISSGTPLYFTGLVYATAVFDGIGGTEVASPNFHVGGAYNPDAAGNAWTSSFTSPAPTFDLGSEPFGVHVVDCAKGGATAETFAAGVTDADSASTDIADWIEGFAPSLVTIALGVNDWAHGRDPAVFKDDLRAIIGTIQIADPELQIILIPWFEPHPAYHYYPNYGYGEYVQAQQELADEIDGVDIINYYLNPIGTGLESDGTNRPADVPGGIIDCGAGYGLHPSDSGSATINTKMVLEIDPATSTLTVI